MKSRKPIAIASAILVFVASPAALAQAQAKKPKAPTPARQKVFAKYDLDHNGNLDVSESETLRQVYEKTPTDPILKPFDTNSDSLMSDQEIMKIVYPNGVPGAKPKAKAKPKPKAKPKAKPKG